MRTEEAQQAGEEFVSNRKGSRHFKFWRNKVCKMGRYEMLALFVIFGLVLSAMLGGLTALMVIALRMGGHLNNIERTLSPLEERASQWRRLSLSRRTLQAATTTAARAPRRDPRGHIGPWHLVALRKKSEAFTRLLKQTKIVKMSEHEELHKHDIVQEMQPLFA